ncbi:MAG: hypothetical protein JXA60_12210 [Candidatus Coatesbacteria bacterium]|nr:hypothetical protein [Candidatus Coatesbacteria bacterium]
MKEEKGSSFIKKYVFLDANIFLHFKKIDEINWIEELKADEVCLKITKITLKELANQKDINPRKYLREKAQIAIQELEDIFENNIEVRPNVTIEHIITKIDESIFLENNLDPQSNDNILIAYIIDFKNRNSTNEVYLISEDIGAKLIAKSFQISIIKLDPKYKLKGESDELEKQIKILEKENLELKNKLPKLFLKFENKTNILQIYNGELIYMKDEEIEEEMKQLKSKYPFISETKKVTDAPLSGIFASFQKSPSDYNRELEDFYKNYLEYLKQKQAYDIISHFSISFSLLLKNEGTSPANRITVKLHFGDGLRIYKENDFPVEPEKPDSPSQSRFNTANISVPSINSHNSFNKIIQENIDKQRKPIIRKTNSYEVVFKPNFLQHYSSENLDPIFVFFKDLEFKPLNIHYLITCDELPYPSKGELIIKFED